MYCPNCGVEIHAEGSFCAKCRKNVAYLTQKENETPATPQPAAEEAVPTAEASEKKAAAASPVSAEPQKNFYCNFCGTAVFPADNYCYQCGKKTRKEYYHPGKITKKRLFSFGSKN